MHGFDAYVDVSVPYRMVGIVLQGEGSTFLDRIRERVIAPGLPTSGSVMHGVDADTNFHRDLLLSAEIFFCSAVLWRSHLYQAPGPVKHGIDVY